MHMLKIYSSLFCILFFASGLKAQFTVSGTVFDSTKTVPVEDVLIKSNSGTVAKTDSMGHYNIAVKDNDSIAFIYKSKPTTRFAVTQIENIGCFNISLHIRVYDKFRTLKEVRVFTRSYRQDSLEN